MRGEQTKLRAAGSAWGVLPWSRANRSIAYRPTAIFEGIIQKEARGTLLPGHPVTRVYDWCASKVRPEVRHVSKKAKRLRLRPLRCGSRAWSGGDEKISSLATNWSRGLA